MDPSQQEHCGNQNRAPTAAQLQAFADRQNIVAGQKRAANEVSDLEIPEGSRPILVLDRTRNRPNHPKYDSQQRLSSDPSFSSSLPPINATESPVPHQHVESSSAPNLPSSTAVAFEAPSAPIKATESPVPHQHVESPSAHRLPSSPAVSSKSPSAPIKATKSPVPHQHVELSSAPYLPSSPAVAFESPSDVMDSDVPEPSAEAAISTASSNSRPLDSKISSPSPKTFLSSLDRRSPAVQSLLREAFNEGRAEGRRESEVKLDEATAKVEQLRKRLDPSKLKASYERGWLEGSIAGYNKYSLNPETQANEDRLAFEKLCKEKDKAIHDQQMTMAKYQKELMARKNRIQTLEQQASLGSHPETKTSEDRLAFEKICKEKDKAIHDQQMIMARYQKELMARKNRIQTLEQQASLGSHPETKASEDRLAFEKICKEKDKAIHDQQMTMAKYQKELMARKNRIQALEQQASLGSPQPPSQQQGQNITGQQISEAEQRFSAQWRELEATRFQNERMREDLANWQVQWGLITADLEKWKAAFSAKAEQLDAYQRQLGLSSGKLQECITKANELAEAKSVETGSLKAATEELESKLNVLSFDFNSLDRLYTTLVQVAAQRSAQADSVKALNEELEGTSKQAQDRKDVINALTLQNNKLTKQREQLEEKVGRQAEEIQGLSKKNEKLKQERNEREAEDAMAPRNSQPSPNQAVDQTTGGVDDLPTNLAQETAAAEIELTREVLERERRATEAESLRRENRATAALDEMRETDRRRRQSLIDELEDKNAQLYDAQVQIRELNERLLAASPPQPSPEPPSAPATSPSPPPFHPEATSSPTEPPPPSIPTASAVQSQPSFRLPRIPATDAPAEFSPRRILIMLAIFFLAFLFPFLRSFSRPASEDVNSRQIATEVLPEVEVVSMEPDYEERNRQWRAWAMGNWERNERIARGEVVDEAHRLFDGWDH